MCRKNGIALLFVVLLLMLSACGSPNPTLSPDSTIAIGGDTLPTESIADIPETTATLPPAPTETEIPPTPTETQIPPTPTLAPVGISRSNPFPSMEVATTPNWEIQVLEIKRGDDAWLDIQAANSYNDPAPDGMEYILIKIHVKCLYEDSEEHSISSYDFDVTGDKDILYTAGMASVVEPEPDLDATLFSGGETEGWTSFVVTQGEGNLILVVDESWDFEEGNERYIALDAGASISVAPELLAITPSKDGESRKSPIPYGEMLVTDNWETSIIEVVRGEAAWSMVQVANQFNEPPSEGYEYIAVKFFVRNIGTDDKPQNINSYFYNITGSANILHELPTVVDPEPGLDISLFPGGEYVGWVVFESIIGETDLMVAFEETWSYDFEPGFLALDEGASLEVPVELQNITPTEFGKDKSNPAPKIDKVITEDWEISVVEVIRGPEAWNMVLAANQFNDPPDDGFEYVAIKVYVHNIGSTDEATDVSMYSFNTTGSAGILHDVPSVVGPEPVLSVSLYPGGEFEGWIIMQAVISETDLLLKFEPWLDFSDDNVRYISLDD